MAWKIVLPIVIVRPLLGMSMQQEEVETPSTRARSVKYFVDIPIKPLAESKSVSSFQEQQYQAQKGAGKASKSKHFDSRSNLLHVILHGRPVQQPIFQ
eukprot:3631985-Karenia_brevis.AAC.1